MNKNVVIACGLQKAYLHPQGTKYFGEKSDIMRVRIKDYLKSLDFSQNILYLLREIHQTNDNFFSNTVTHSIVGTKDTEIPEEIKPYVKIVVDVTRYSGFYKTLLESELHKIKPKNIYLLGFETHTLILFTAEELRNRGYKVTLLEPLIASEDDYLHAMGITLMKNFLAVDIKQE